MTATRLSGRLPDDDDNNGLRVIRRALLEDPQQQHVVIAMVDCSKITEDTDSGVRSPTIRIQRIEPVTDANRQLVLQGWMREEYELRTGRAELPEPPDGWGTPRQDLDGGEGK